MWNATFSEKKTIYGPRRVRVGTEKVDEDESDGSSSEEEERKDDNLEPVFYRLLGKGVGKGGICQHARLRLFLDLSSSSSYFSTR